MDKKELTEMCRTIFTSSVNSATFNTTITEMVNLTKNGEIPFKAKPINDFVFDNSNYVLGVIDLGEYMIYDSLKTGKVGDSIGRTRYLRLTRGSGENMRELDIEL